MINLLGAEGILVSTTGGVALPLTVEGRTSKYRKKSSGFSDFGPS